MYYLQAPLFKSSTALSPSSFSLSLPHPHLSLKRNLAPQPHITRLSRLVALLNHLPLLLGVNALTAQHLHDGHHAPGTRRDQRLRYQRVACTLAIGTGWRRPRDGKRDVPHAKAVISDAQPAQHDGVAGDGALGRRVGQRAVRAGLGDGVRVHDAGDLALRVLAAARERHEDLARVGELADRRAVHRARVNECPDDRDAVGQRVEHQEVRHAGFERGHCGRGVCDRDAEARVDGCDAVEGVVCRRVSVSSYSGGGQGEVG